MRGRPICYVASPIDQLKTGPLPQATQVQRWRDMLQAYLLQEGWSGFWPNKAFGGDLRIGDTAQVINNAVIERCQGMVVLWPTGIDSAGIPGEIDLWTNKLDRGAPCFVQDEFNLVEITEYLREQRLDAVAGLQPSERPTMKVKQLHPDAVLPTQAHDDDAGWDLYACEDVEIPLGEAVDVPFGIAVEPPPGHWVRIIGRSSTARLRGLDVIEAVIDYGYRGPLYASTRNLVVDTAEPLVATVRKGERIAQAILVKSEPVDLVWAGDLAPSKRGESGFGSSGT